MKKVVLALAMINFVLSVYFGGDITSAISAVYVMGSFTLMILAVIWQ